MAGRTKMPSNTFCGRIEPSTRRDFLRTLGGGFTSLALTGMLLRDGFLGQQAFAADGKTPFQNPLAPKPPHFPARAKRVI